MARKRNVDSGRKDTLGRRIMESPKDLAKGKNVDRKAKMIGDDVGGSQKKSSVSNNREDKKMVSELSSLIDKLKNKEFTDENTLSQLRRLRNEFNKISFASTDEIIADLSFEDAYDAVVKGRDNGLRSDVVEKLRQNRENHINNISVNLMKNVYETTILDESYSGDQYSNEPRELRLVDLPLDVEYEYNYDLHDDEEVTLISESKCKSLADKLDVDADFLKGEMQKALDSGSLDIYDDGYSCGDMFNVNKDGSISFYGNNFKEDISDFISKNKREIYEVVESSVYGYTHNPSQTESEFLWQQPQHNDY